MRDFIMIKSVINVTKIKTKKGNLRLEQAFRETARNHKLRRYI